MFLTNSLFIKFHVKIYRQTLDALEMTHVAYPRFIQQDVFTVKLSEKR